ncbi:HAD-like domain-containing protein [Kalaharituber pfeilii]|nr:HAD-like domain-containing protein [Kalaharituber pfeilii]
MDSQAAAQEPKLSDFKVLCFDVYGTLIDWETGIYNAALPLLKLDDTESATPALSRAEFLSLYEILELAQQARTPSMKYSTILTSIHEQLSSPTHLNRPTISESQHARFGASVPTWPAFPDSLSTLLALRNPHGYKLVVLSNVDWESFAGTCKVQFGKDASEIFDVVLTAEDIGSYKPSRRNFKHMLEVIKKKWNLGEEDVLQVAQSRVHDHVPAQEMGIKSVWVNRRGANMGGPGDVPEGAWWDWEVDSMGSFLEMVEHGARRNGRVKPSP